MTTAFAKPSEAQKQSPKAKPAKKKKAGGDDRVERDHHDRPLILTPCYKCDASGKVPSEKVAGRLNKCQRCKGEGKKKEAYTRVTTFIDVLEDKSNIQAWCERMVLLGVHADRKLLNDLEDFDPNTREGKDGLNRRAQIAKDKGGANERSEKGSHLHELSELIDAGKELPDDGLYIEDIVDIDAYYRATRGFSIRHMEELVVNDELGAAGTPDRVSEWRGDGPLIAPDGYEFNAGELIITDLKTGASMEYGALKMAMQLAMYSRSKLLDLDTHERVGIENLNQRWGIIMHVAAGSGEAVLYWVDLELGWEAVQLAAQVRKIRNRGRKALIAVEMQAERQESSAEESV